MSDFIATTNWSMWQAIAAWVILVVTGITYVLKNVFKLGGLSGRIDRVESEIQELKVDVKDAKRNLGSQINELRIKLEASSLNKV